MHSTLLKTLLCCCYSIKYGTSDHILSFATGARKVQKVWIHGDCQNEMETWQAPAIIILVQNKLDRTLNKITCYILLANPRVNSQYQVNKVGIGHQMSDKL